MIKAMDSQVCFPPRFTRVFWAPRYFTELVEELQKKYYPIDDVFGITSLSEITKNGQVLRLPRSRQLAYLVRIIYVCLEWKVVESHCIKYASNLFLSYELCEHFCCRLIAGD